MEWTDTVFKRLCIIDLIELMTTSSPLHIIPLGGLGEIGLNMMAFEYEDTIFVVDAGLMFPEDYMLGVDYVTPDMSYLKENRARLAGIILTHAHEDHIGALPYLLRIKSIPVFGTPFTLGMAAISFRNMTLTSTAQLHPFNPEESLSIGPVSTGIHPGGTQCGGRRRLAIQTPVGTSHPHGRF